MRNNWNIYWVLFTFLGIHFSCSNDDKVDPIFDVPVDQRVSQTLDSYEKSLISSEFGWKVKYQPKNSIGVYNVYLKFNADNTTEITSDFNRGIDDLESTYRVGISHFPELVFENYTVFHKLYELDGFNLDAEFEFIFEEVSADKIILRSKTDVGDDITKVVLEKATAEDKSIVENLRDFYESLEFGFKTESILRNLVVANSSNQIVFNSTFTFNEGLRQGVITTFDQESGAINSQRYPIEVNLSGFNLVEPFVYNGIEFTQFIYNPDDNTYTSVNSEQGLIAVIGYDLAPVSTGLVPALFSEEVDNFGIDFSNFLYFDDSSGFFLRQTSEDFLQLGKSNDFRVLDIIFDDQRFNGLTTVELVLNGKPPILMGFEVQRIPGERIIFSFVGATDDITPYSSFVSLLSNPNGWYVQRTRESRFQFNPSFLLTSVVLPNYRFSVYGL